jgi:hypothetical protein
MQYARVTADWQGERIRSLDWTDIEAVERTIRV